MNPPVYTTDTSPDAAAIHLECFRQMSPQERIRKTCAMSRRVKNMALDAIRRQHPNLSDGDVQLMFIELTYGKALADAVRSWQQENCH